MHPPKIAQETPTICSTFGTVWAKRNTLRSQIPNMIRLHLVPIQIIFFTFTKTKIVTEE